MNPAIKKLHFTVSYDCVYFSEQRLFTGDASAEVAAHSAGCISKVILWSDWCFAAKEVLINLGDQLDHYRLDAVVSRSEGSTVFRGTDLRTNQPVAIKVPHPEVEGDPESFDRFRREEEIGKSLNHPGILKVLGDDHHERRYLVTEWFEGKTLREVLVEAKILPQDQAVRITLAICDALEYIHNHGIVHRDLRPENILVGEGDRIKLINFGIAAKEGSPRLTFTNLSHIIGTIVYISPEELKGKRGDARSDIYALGVILYEMLTGKTPFQGTDPFDRLLSHPIPPRELVPSISPQLQEVIYRALEKEHQNRYPTVHEFAHDLSHLDQVGVAERPELRNWKQQRKPDSKRTLLIAAIILIPIVLFGMLLYFARH